MIINKNLSFGTLLDIKRNVINDLNSDSRESYPPEERKQILDEFITLKSELNEDAFQQDNLVVTKGKNPYAHDAYSITLVRDGNAKKLTVRKYPTADIIRSTLEELRALFSTDEAERKLSNRKKKS